MYLVVEQLGKVRLIPNPRARRVIIRFRDEEFQVTHPLGMSIGEIEALLGRKKAKLAGLKPDPSSQFLFTEETVFSTYTFDVVVRKHNLNSVYTTLQGGILRIAFPQNTNLSEPEIQKFIKTAIEAACRAEAKRVLPLRVRELACLHGFSVLDVKINKSRSRWGSCSSRKNINLSFFCMMLPAELIDLVILHELCHTKEMNHGKEFWALLDRVIDGKSEELTRLLKVFKLKW